MLPVAMASMTVVVWDLMPSKPSPLWCRLNLQQCRLAASEHGKRHWREGQKEAEISTLANGVPGSINDQHEGRRKRGVSKWKKMNSALEILITSWEMKVWSSERCTAEPEGQGWSCFLRTAIPRVPSLYLCIVHRARHVCQKEEMGAGGMGSRKTTLNCFDDQVLYHKPPQS